jgi:hypothetical protein
LPENLSMGSTDSFLGSVLFIMFCVAESCHLQSD